MLSVMQFWRACSAEVCDQSLMRALSMLLFAVHLCTAQCHCVITSNTAFGASPPRPSERMQGNSLRTRALTLHTALPTLHVCAILVAVLGAARWAVL
jgi:hypothetical protein